MAEFDLVVRGGNVAFDGTLAQLDVGIQGETIAAIDRGLGRGSAEIDAAGLLVLPGGVDSHCHMDQQPWEGRETADDFRSGTLSALCGGNTTVIPFAMQMQGQSLSEVVADYHRRASRKAFIDYAFHLVVGDPTADVLEHELPALFRSGCTSIKIFLTYERLKLDDYQVLQVLALARREGIMVMVHAENDACIRWLTDRLIESGRIAPHYHVVAHPAIGDREATHRAISFAELLEVPILIAHVGAAAAVEQIRWARSRGLEVYGETCPQYLLLSAEDIHTPDMEGAKYVCTPPPRAKSNQPALWQALADGTLQIFSSDHSPWRYEDKIRGGPSTPFTKIPNGVPGIETRLPLLFSEGVGKGRITLQQFIELGATTPARLYGLYPRKGVIARGADADLALWDPDKSVTIRNDMLHHNTDYTPYEGMTVKGWPVMTISRGALAWNNGEVLGQPGSGRFLPCERPVASRLGLDLDLAR